MIRLEGVGLRYGPDQDASHRDASGAEALFGLNIVMPQAGFAWVVGPTGAGKTSLLRLLQLDQTATWGRVVGSPCRGFASAPLACFTFLGIFVEAPKQYESPG